MPSTPINPTPPDGTISVDSPMYASEAAEATSWLSVQFEAMGTTEVPDFDYTPQNVSALHLIVAASNARNRASEIVSAEYRAETARVREILESAGLATESLSESAVSSVEVISSVALIC